MILVSADKRRVTWLPAICLGLMIVLPLLTLVIIWRDSLHGAEAWQFFAGFTIPSIFLFLWRWRWIERDGADLVCRWMFFTKRLKAEQCRSWGMLPIGFLSRTTIPGAVGLREDGTRRLFVFGLLLDAARIVEAEEAFRTLGIQANQTLAENTKQEIVTNRKYLLYTFVAVLVLSPLLYFWLAGIE